MEDLFATLAGGKTFTKLHLSQTYQQIELEKSSKNYVVINTQKGLFRYTRFPYGVASASGIFRGLWKICHRWNKEAQWANLHEVFQRLEKAGLHLRKDKCVYIAPSVTYLGHKIDEEGVHPIICYRMVKAINAGPSPQNEHQLKAYLELLN